MCGRAFYVATIVGLWVETLLYGIYLVLFLGSVYIQWYRKPDKWLFGMSLMTFALSSASIATVLAVTILTPDYITTTVCSGDSCLACPGATSSKRSQQLLTKDALNVAINTIFLASQVAADGLLIYRSYIVWEAKLHIVIIPILTLIGTAGCICANTVIDIILYYMTKSADIGPRFAYLGSVGDVLSQVQLSLALFTNIVVTALIVLRVWWLTRRNEEVLGKRSGALYRSVIIMVVESGALICASLIVTLIIQRCVMYVPNILDAIVNQILGIAPTLILIRVGLGDGIEQTTLYDPNIFTSRISPYRSLAFAGNPSTEGDNRQSRVLRRNTSKSSNKDIDIALVSRNEGDDLNA